MLRVVSGCPSPCRSGASPGRPPAGQSTVTRCEAVRESWLVEDRWWTDEPAAASLLGGRDRPRARRDRVSRPARRRLVQTEVSRHSCGVVPSQVLARRCTREPSMHQGTGDARVRGSARGGRGRARDSAPRLPQHRRSVERRRARLPARAVHGHAQRLRDGAATSLHGADDEHRARGHGEARLVRSVGRAGLLRAERSDGSVSVTLLDASGRRARPPAWAPAGICASGRSMSARARLPWCEAVARLGGGRTWRVDDMAAAQRLERRLAEVLAGHGRLTACRSIGTALHLAQHLFDVGDGRDLPPQASRVFDARAGLEASLKLPGGSRLAAALAAGVGYAQASASGDRSGLLRVDGDAGVAIVHGLGGLSGSARRPAWR